MAERPRISHTTALILQAVASGYIYGYTVMEATGLPSGTVYPALRRLELEGLIESDWEDAEIATAEMRPPRKYFRLTGAGETVVEAAQRRYPLLAKMERAEEVEQ